MIWLKQLMIKFLIAGGLSEVSCFNDWFLRMQKIVLMKQNIIWGCCTGSSPSVISK